MDLARSFTYVFEDADWVKKILIAALVSLIPIVGWFVVGGWALEITRRVAQGEGEALPDWGDFGAYLARGVKGWVVGLVYGLPLGVVWLCQVIFGLLGNPDVVGYDTAQSLAPLVGLVGLCLGCLSFLYSIVMGLILPAALAKFVVEGDSIGAGLRFGEVFALVREHLTAYLLVLVGSFIAGLLSGVGVIACGVGVLLTSVYAVVVMGHLYGQVYREATGAAVSAAV